MFKAKLDHTLSPPTGTAPQGATMTRRAAIGTAMVLATPTLASLQAALASPVVVEADPVFAAIEAHQTANVRWNAADVAADRARGDFRDRNYFFKPDALAIETRKAMAECDPRFAHATIPTHDAIEALSGEPWDAPGVKAALHAELDRQAADYAEHVAPLIEASNAAYDAEYQAMWALAETQPSTAAGIVAVLRYIRERREPHGELFSQDDQRGDCVAVFQHSLERAACAIAGLPAPVVAPEQQDDMQLDPLRRPAG